MTNRAAVLVLQDGTIFEGSSFGAIGKTIGEVCFNTSITGYQEVLTDPSYSNQIVTMTAPHIGNYGINSEDVESSKVQVSGFIIKEESFLASSWRSQMSINDYLKNEKIVGIKDIDSKIIFLKFLFKVLLENSKTKVIRKIIANNAKPSFFIKVKMTKNKTVIKFKNKFFFLKLKLLEINLCIRKTLNVK